MDEIDQLGRFADDPDDPDAPYRAGPVDARREGRRTVLALVAAAGLGTLAVVAVIWVLSLGGGAPSPDQADGGAVAALSSTAESTSETDASDQSALGTPTTGTTSVVTPPTVAPTRPPVDTSTLNLPPREQPTYTLAPASRRPTAPSAPAPPTATAGPAPKPTPRPTAPNPPPRPSGPKVSGVGLTCTKAGGQTRARLTFRTTAPVSAWLSGGGRVVAGTKGPGVVSLQVSGGRTGFCLALVGAASYGPVPAS